jgi:hypothetical protein
LPKCGWRGDEIATRPVKLAEYQLAELLKEKLAVKDIKKLQ